MNDLLLATFDRGKTKPLDIPHCITTKDGVCLTTCSGKNSWKSLKAAKQALRYHVKHLIRWQAVVTILEYLDEPVKMSQLGDFLVIETTLSIHELEKWVYDYLVTNVVTFTPLGQS